VRLFRRDDDYGLEAVILDRAGRYSGNYGRWLFDGTGDYAPPGNVSRRVKKALSRDQWQAVIARLEELQFWQMATRSKGFPGTEPVTNEALLELDCDILIPAANENQIRQKNAGNIKAKIIVEGANGPTTQRADEILNGKNVLVVPDILANAGGVTVSYFEWVQDRAGFFWRESEVNERLEDIMVQSFRDVASMAEKYNVSFRIAAYMLGISRVAHDTMVRGLYA